LTKAGLPVQKRENEYKPYSHDDLLELKIMNERLKQAESQLKLAELHALPLLAYANDAVIVANSQGQIIWWNNAAQTMFCYNATEIQGRDIHVLIPEPLKETHKVAFDKAVKEGRMSRSERNGLVESEGITKFGDIFPISLSLTMWLSTNNEWFFGTIIRRIAKE